MRAITADVSALSIPAKHVAPGDFLPGRAVRVRSTRWGTTDGADVVEIVPEAGKAFELPREFVVNVERLMKPRRR